MWPYLEIELSTHVTCNLSCGHTDVGYAFSITDCWKIPMTYVQNYMITEAENNKDWLQEGFSFVLEHGFWLRV